MKMVATKLNMNIVYNLCLLGLGTRWSLEPRQVCKVAIIRKGTHGLHTSVPTDGGVTRRNGSMSPRSIQRFRLCYAVAVQCTHLQNLVLFFGNHCYTQASYETNPWYSRLDNVIQLVY